MSEIPPPSDLEVEYEDTYTKIDLPESCQMVFNELDIPFRTKDYLRCSDTSTDTIHTVKFATMNMYPHDKDKNPDAPQVCNKHNIVGVGWGRISSDEVPGVEPADAIRVVNDNDNNKSVVNDFAYFASWLNKGDIVITKNVGTVASYARITSELKHRSEADFEEELRENDLGFYREAEWVDVRPVDAPAKVLSTTCRGTVTLPELDYVSMQQILKQFQTPIGEIDRDTDIEELKKKFRYLAKQPSDENKKNSNRLIDNLSASGRYNDLETAVCTYVQRITESTVHPSSRSYPGVEAIFRHSSDGEAKTYGIQVKRSSFDDEDRKQLEQFAEKHDNLFLFSASGDKIPGEHITNIGEARLSKYICQNPYDLPPPEIDRLCRAYEYGE